VALSPQKVQRRKKTSGHPTVHRAGVRIIYMILKDLGDPPSMPGTPGTWVLCDSARRA
jgi:hypothetical protein